MPSLRPVIGSYDDAATWSKIPKVRATLHRTIVSTLRSANAVASSGVDSGLYTRDPHRAAHYMPALEEYGLWAKSTQDARYISMSWIYRIRATSLAFRVSTVTCGRELHYKRAEGVELKQRVAGCRHAHGVDGAGRDCFGKREW